MILVLRVVAVLDIGTCELAEANCHLHHRAAVGLRADAIDVLAGVAFPDRRRPAVAGENLPFLEVDMNRVAPASAVALDAPDFPRAHLRGSGNALDVGGEAIAAIGLDRPRRFVRAATAAELERPPLGLGKVSCGNLRQRDHLLLALDIVSRVHAQVLARVGLDAELHEFADGGVALVLAGENFVERDLFLGAGAVAVLQRVHEVELRPHGILAEVDDDVEALSNRLRWQVFRLGVREGNGMLHDVAVVGDHVERHAHALVRHDRDLEVARDRAIEQAQAILARPHVHIGFPGPVDRHLVAEETVLVEDVEGELPLGVPGLVRDQKVHVIVAVAPVEARAARQAEIGVRGIRVVALETFAPTVHRAVIVHHRGVALVHVLGRVIDHVIVEPVRALGLAPVAADLDHAARAIRHAGAWVGSVDVLTVATSQLHGPAIVVVLAGIKIGASEPVALGGVVAVVFVGRDQVVAKAVVGGDVDRKPVKVAEQDRLADARHQEFGR